MDPVLGEVRRVILEEAAELGVRVERIILFGSRARGEARENSDYDILIIVEGSLGREERRRLARSLIPCDLVITSTSKWRQYSKTTGHLFHTIEKEGVTV